MEVMDILTYEIYPRLDRADIVPELDPQNKGSYYLVSCPQCGQRKAFVYKDGFAIKCNRLNECSYHKSLWDYLQETKNLTAQDTLIELARLAGITLPDNGKISQEAIRERNEKADALEVFLSLSQKALRESEEAQSYLKGRGFTLEEALEYDIGYYPGQDTIKASITDNTNITRALLSSQWEKRIIGLWRDRAGRGLTVWGRDITGQKEPKYYYLYGEPKNSPYGLERGFQSELIAVEGILDAVSLQKAGIEGVIATGGAGISGDQIKSLVKARVKSVTLNLDNDPAGYAGIDRAIDNLEGAGIKTYVIEPSLMPIPPGKEKSDPDDYIREYGIEAYKGLLDKAERGVEWKIDRLVKGQDITLSKGKDAVLSEGTAFLNKIEDAVIFDYGIKKLASVLEMPVDTIDEICLSTKEKQKQEGLKKEYSSILEEAKGEGFNGLQDAVRRLQDLKARSGIIQVKPLSPFLDEKREKDRARESDLLGYRLNKFKDLCRNIDGLQTGYYLFAGYTNTGKTAFLANIFLDLLDSNEDLTGIYFSLDDSKEIIINRMLSIMAEVEINRVQKFKKLDPEESHRVNNAYDKLKDLAESGRFFLEDISNIDNVDALESYISNTLKTRDKLFIAIDGLYNLGVGSEADGIRVENIERANRIKGIVDTYNVPILCTGELRKQTKQKQNQKTPPAPTIDDLMETGKFAYNSNLVLLLYPENTADFEAEADEIKLCCKYAKNKLSWYRRTDTLLFKRKYSIMEEDNSEDF